MNKFQTSRFINNYIANLELNDLLVNEIKKVVAKFKINLKDIGNNEIFDKVLSYHMNDILKTYPEIKDYINKEQFKQKLIKKYCFAFAQDEIASNLNTPVGINTPITEENKAEVLKARQIAMQKTGYKPTNIFDQLKTYGEDVYGNARYSPYEFPVNVIN